MVVLLNGVSGALARQNAAMEYNNECVHAPAPLRQMVEKTVKEQTSSFRHAPAVNAPNLVSDDWFRCHMKKAFISELEKKTKSEKLYFSSCRNSLSDCRVLFTLVYLFKFFCTIWFSGNPWQKWVEQPWRVLNIDKWTDITCRTKMMIIKSKGIRKF